MASGAERLRLRVFKVPEGLDLLLSNRASGGPDKKSDLARKYVASLLSDKTLASVADVGGSPLVLRSYYLTPAQDEDLRELAKRLSRQGGHISRGRLFRAALARGLGMRDQPALPTAVGLVPSRTRRYRQLGGSGRGGGVQPSTIGDPSSAVAPLAQRMGVPAAIAIAAYKIIEELKDKGQVAESVLSEETRISPAETAEAVDFLEGVELVERAGDQVVLTA